MRKKIKKIIGLFKSKIIGKEVIYIENQINAFLEYKIIEKGIDGYLNFDFDKIKINTFNFTKKLKCKENFGYYYCKSSSKTSLYSTIYAILVYSLYGELENIIKNEKQKLVDYINSFQNEEDGLYYDDNIQNQYYNDSDWWGARHLNLHIINALIALNEKPKYKFKFLYKYYDLEYTKKWLDSFEWNDSFTHENDIDNKLMNVVIALQYQRDYWEDENAKKVVDFIQKYLISKINTDTGMWGNYNINDKDELSRMVQFAYHLLTIFEYDGIDLGNHSKYIDYTLQTQNIYGGFGVNLNSSACEDIDSIYILIKMNLKTNYKIKEIDIALKKAFIFVLSNQNDDGGFVFRRDEKFWFGHEEMTSEINQSAIFPTWFRTLSIAYLAEYFNISGYNIIKTPGY